MNAVLAKAAGAILLAPLSLDAVRLPLERRLAKSTPLAWTVVFFASRLAIGLCAFTWFQLGLPGDVAHYYAGFGGAVLQSGSAAGSPYSPVFDYLMAALLWLFRTPLSFVIFAIVAEAAAFAIAANAIGASDAPLARAVAALWLVSPISIVNVALGGQDEALILLAVAGAMWAVLSRRTSAAGVIVAVGIVASKVLAVFAGLPLLCLSGRRLWRGVAAAALTLGIAVLALSIAGVPVLGFASEARRITPGNLWAIASLAVGRQELWPPLVIGAATMGGLVLTVLVIRMSPADAMVEQALRAVGTAGCVFLLLSFKSFPGYLVMFLPGILFLLLKVTRSLRTALILVFVPCVVVESSLWFALEPFGESLPTTARGRLVLAAVDLVLVSGYAALAWRGLTLGRLKLAAIQALNRA
jgi:hypothetical protein